MVALPVPMRQAKITMSHCHQMPCLVLVSLHRCLPIGLLSSEALVAVLIALLLALAELADSARRLSVGS